MKTAEVPLITLSGTPREQGRRYGELAAGRIAAAHETTRRLLTDAGYDADAYVRWLGSEAPFAATVARLTPNYRDFLSGLAEGSGRPFDWTVCQNLWDEDDWSRSFREAPERAGPRERCTALAGTVPGGAIGGQNMDIGLDYEGSQVVLHFDESTGMQRYVLSSAGISGLCGMNAAGVGLFMNTLDQLNSSFSGLPVTAFVFEVLQQGSLAAAARWLGGHPHASGQAYTLVGPDGVAGFEASAAGCRAYPALAGGHLVHTNHPLIDADRREPRSSAEQALVADGTGSRIRYDTAASLIAGDGSWSVESIQRVLASRCDPKAPISKTAAAAERAAIGYTFGSIVCDSPLDGPAGCYIAGGPPSDCAYLRLEFDSTPAERGPADRTTLGQAARF